MNYNGEDIKKRRDDIQNNILKSFDCDIEKAVAQIGETRQWSDGTYKKVSEGKWTKITDGKEKAVASSGMSKKLSEELKTKSSEWQKIKDEFENSLEKKYPKGSIAYKVFFENAWGNEIGKNKFIKRIREEQRDINDEIREIEVVLNAEKKARREAKAGKKEYDVNDIKDSLKEANSLFQSVKREIPKTNNAKEVIPQVTIDDYYLDTETVFSSIVGKEDNWKDIDDRWDNMKNSGKYHWHKSPKSSSEYLIDESNGDVFRFSDHWGRVASCTWGLISDNENKWDIAKSNIKDFERKETGMYFNPIYRTKMLEAANKVLPRLKKLASENPKYYLTDKAKKEIKQLTDKIFVDLQYSAELSIDEVSKLRKKYEII